MIVGSAGVGKTLLSEWLFQKTKMENRNTEAYGSHCKYVCTLHQLTDGHNGCAGMCHRPHTV
jgi:hypothetical protein